MSSEDPIEALTHLLFDCKSYQTDLESSWNDIVGQYYVQERYLPMVESIGQLLSIAKQLREATSVCRTAMAQASQEKAEALREIRRNKR